MAASRLRMHLISGPTLALLAAARVPLLTAQASAYPHEVTTYNLVGKSVAFFATPVPTATGVVSPASSYTDNGNPVLLITLVVILMIVLSGAGSVALALRKRREVGTQSNSAAPPTPEGER